MLTIATSPDLSPLGTLVHHFRMRTQDLHMLGISLVGRSQNIVANRLAAYGSSLDVPMFVFDGVFMNSAHLQFWHINHFNIWFFPSKKKTL